MDIVSLFIWLLLAALILASCALTAMLPLVLIPALLAVEQSSRRQAALWSQARRALRGGGRGRQIIAEVRGRPVRVLTRTKVRMIGKVVTTDTFTFVEVGGLQRRLTLERQDPFDGLFGGKDLEIGDQDFDAAFRIGGQALALGMLDADARAHLMACPYTFSLRGGTLALSMPGLPGSVKGLQAMVQWATALADLLAADDTELGRRVFDLARSDPMASVRHAAIMALIQAFPDRRDVVAAEAIGDPVVELRVWGAQVLGRDDVLIAALVDPLASEAAKIDAIGGLRGGSLAEAASIVAAAEAPRLWRAAAQAAVADSDPAGAAALLALAGRLDPRIWPSDREEVARRVAAARVVAAAWGRLDGAAPALLGLLAIDDDEVHVGALRGMGAVGTVAEVPALRRYAATAGGAARAAAERAVAAIQARADGSRGELALAVSGGDLALAAVARAPER